MPQVSLAEFLAAVQSGELVSFPTDTVPALAALPSVGDRIYQLKQRSQAKPLILMGATLADLWPYVVGSEAEQAQWTTMAERYWPGALTLVLPASDRLPPAMNPTHTGTLGLRIPAHPLARYLLERTGPLATTSVNHSGQPPRETLAEIEAEFPALITLSPAALAEIYTQFGNLSIPPMDQPQGSGQPSTVVAWRDGQWDVLRQGAITIAPLTMTSPSDADALASLQLAYDRLQQQYQSLAAFLGTASHELRAPINQVISLHQIILEDLCENPAEEREFIAQANQSITRLLNNLDTLISLSKLDLGVTSPVCEPVPLGTVLNKVRQFTEMQCINRQCRLTVTPGPDSLWVLSDSRWLLQALISLVEAALAAGSTAITLERLKDGKPQGEGDQPNDQSVVTLQLICNAPANQWPPNLPTSLTVADSPSPPDNLLEASPQSSQSSLSPDFRYHLAHRILGHLGSAIHPSASATDDPHRLTIRLSITGEGRDA